MSDSKFTLPYTVDAAFIDGRLRFTLIGMMNCCQSAASFHYGEHKMSIPHMVKKGRTWVVVKQHLEISEYPEWRDELLFKSWMEGIQGISSQYDFVFSYRGQHGRKQDWDEPWQDKSCMDCGPVFMRGMSQWMQLDIGTLRPARLEAADFEDMGLCAEKACSSPYPRLVPCQSYSVEKHFTPGRLEIDLNGHVNNIEYIKYIMSYLPEQELEGMLVSEIDTNFVSSAHRNDELVCRSTIVPAEEGDDPDAKTCMHVITRSDGSQVFRARTKWLPENRLSRGLWGGF